MEDLVEDSIERAKEQREKQFDGICDDLRDSANDALEALEALRAIEMSANWTLERADEEILRVFREFSDADVEGLHDLACGGDNTGGLAVAWIGMGKEFEPDFKEINRGIDGWYGAAADSARNYIDKLEKAYGQSVTSISEVEADVVATRDIVHTARQDLKDLTDSFCSATKQYLQSQCADQNTLLKVVAATFAGAVVGVCTAGVAAAVAAPEVQVAFGATVAANGIGSGFSKALEVATSGPVSGETPDDVFQSFLDGVEKIRAGVGDAVDALVDEIQKKINTLPEIPSPPDVSPGPSFDPDQFQADGLSDALRESIEKSGKDIPAPRSGAQERSAIANRLDGVPVDDPKPPKH